MSDELLIPLSVLAIEVGVPPAALEIRFCDRVLTDDIGRQCLDRDDAAALIAEHKQRLAAKAERAQVRKAQLAETDKTHTRHRVRAIAAHQTELRASGALAEDVPALSVMAGAGHQQRMERTGRAFDAMLHAGREGVIGTGHRLTPAGPEE